MKTLIVPERLNPGDAIGIVAPGGAVDRDKFEPGIKTIKSLGFNVVMPDGLLDKNGYFSSTDEIRAGHITSFFSDKKIKAILCARGGYGSIRLLEKLDYDLIRKNPKIFVGFSDITILLSAIYLKSKIVTFHGPMVSTLAGSDQFSLEALNRAVTQAENLKINLSKAIIVKPGKATGRIIGGNLSSLCNLIGTEYNINYRDHILFLEDRGEAIYRIDRMAMHLKLAGCFSGLRGLILGSFEECGDYSDIINIFKEALNDIDMPIMAGLDVGHGKTNITIPIGIRATIDTSNKVLYFNQSAIC